jgi:hypothetical protein
MKDLILPIVLCIVLIGVCYWVFNNPNGVGDGLDKGGKNVQQKIIQATN